MFNSEFWILIIAIIVIMIIIFTMMWRINKLENFCGFILFILYGNDEEQMLKLVGGIMDEMEANRKED